MRPDSPAGAGPLTHAYVCACMCMCACMHVRMPVQPERGPHPVDVDDPHEITGAAHFRKIALPSIRDRVDKGPARLEQCVRVVVQIGAEVPLGPLPELGLDAGSDAHHELYVQLCLHAYAVMVRHAHEAVDLIVSRLSMGDLLGEEGRQVGLVHVLCACMCACTVCMYVCMCVGLAHVLRSACWRRGWEARAGACGWVGARG